VAGRRFRRAVDRRPGARLSCDDGGGGGTSVRGAPGARARGRRPPLGAENGLCVDLKRPPVSRDSSVWGTRLFRRPRQRLRRGTHGSREGQSSCYSRSSGASGARRRMRGVEGRGRHLGHGARTAATSTYARTHPSNLRETRVPLIALAPSRSGSQRCWADAAFHHRARLREQADLAFLLMQIDANILHGWPRPRCARERVCSLWGTVGHHVELGVSRFIPSTLRERI
jgi:hypothetical protein